MSTVPPQVPTSDSTSDALAADDLTAPTSESPPPDLSANPDWAADLAAADLRDRFDLIRYQLILYFDAHGHRLLRGSNGVAVPEIKHTLRLDHWVDDSYDDSVSLARSGLYEHMELPDPSVVRHQISVLRAQIAARLTRLSTRGVEAPFEVLRAAFRLSEVEVDFLVAQLAAQVDESLARLYRLAWADFGKQHTTLGFLVELIGDSPERRRAALEAVRAHGTLWRYRLLLMSDANGPVPPRLQRTVALSERVSDFLQFGHRPVASDRGSWAIEEPGGRRSKLDTRVGNTPALHIDPSVRLRLEVALSQRGPRGGCTRSAILIGRPGSGRRTLLRRLAASEGRPLMVVDFKRLLDNATLRGGATEVAVVELAEALREAVLHRARVLIRDADGLELTDRSSAGLGALIALLAAHRDGVVFTADNPIVSLRRDIPGLVEIVVPVLPDTQQELIWLERLKGQLPKAAASQLATALSRRHSLSPGRIFEAVEQASFEARARPRSEGRSLSSADVLRAVRRQFDHSLGDLAELLDTAELSWDDLVLPDELRASLGELQRRMMHRERVLDEWGFRHIAGRARGISCLLSGPPGTGKTLTAMVLANSLGSEVYRVDLSRVVDKYIGETEKNLARVFDEAERAQAVLLFDEADSLFAKRTKVSSSHDRYANLVVNFLLQRIETYEGCCVLTTNFESSIDDAFKRRLTYRLDFPKPNAEQRAKIWRVMVPKTAHQEDEIDWEVLGEHFGFPGGNIRNAVLRAAFRAAESDAKLSTDLLWEAGIKESSEMGLLVRDVTVEQAKAKPGPAMLVEVKSVRGRRARAANVGRVRH